ncbi:Uncharacterised protein [Candidatus Tiddalikarchaeum anstoanum]|nr:Uncharacterised protein [Candidatus Tiddalikarchaeum anstoanum]
MEDYKIVAEQAFREAKMADHMAYVTSKIVNDKKIVISIVDHLSRAFMLSMKAYLIREKLRHNIKVVPEGDKEVTNFFFESYAQELKVEKSILSIIYRLFNAVNAYNSRGILLTRSDKYVFVSPEYELIDLNMNEIKEWLRDGLKFVNAIKERLEQ